MWIPFLPPVFCTVKPSKAITKRLLEKPLMLRVSLSGTRSVWPRKSKIAWVFSVSSKLPGGPIRGKFSGSMTTSPGLNSMAFAPFFPVTTTSSSSCTFSCSGTVSTETSTVPSRLVSWAMDGVAHNNRSMQAARIAMAIPWTELVVFSILFVPFFSLV